MDMHAAAVLNSKCCPYRNLPARDLRLHSLKTKIMERSPERTYRQSRPALDKGCRFSAASCGRPSVSPWPLHHSLPWLPYSRSAMIKRVPNGHYVMWELPSMLSFRLCLPSSEVAF